MKHFRLAAVILTVVSCRAASHDVASTHSAERAEVVKSPAPGRNCPADPVSVGGRDILEILDLLGADREAGATGRQLNAYLAHFNRSDTDCDGTHSKSEYIENGVYMTPQARRGIFAAADNNADDIVTRVEFVLNRIITDEAKEIVQKTDADKNGRVNRTEFINRSPLLDAQLAADVFDALDVNSDGRLDIPEYLRVWGRWARPNYTSQEAAISIRLSGLLNPPQ